MNDHEAQRVVLFLVFCWLVKWFLIWIIVVSVCLMLHIEPGNHWIIKTVITTGCIQAVFLLNTLKVNWN